MSLKKLVENRVWDEQQQQWVDIVPKTPAAAVTTADGSNAQAKFDAIPTQIATAVTQLKDGVDESGDTLAKLRALITAIQTALESDDTTLDTLQEVVNYIKANKDALTLLGGSKVNVDDIVNDLTTVTSGKVLDARQGKALKDLIDAAQSAITALQTQAAGFATKSELTAAIAGAVPVISETAPLNPIEGQLWHKPVGTIVV